MGVSVAIDSMAAPVVPGDRATCDVVLRNTGAIVDQFVLDIVGAVGAWTKLQPATVNLLPGEEQRVQIVFAPPRSPDVSQGPVPYALRVMSREDTAGSVVHEATVDVAPFTDVRGELIPRTSTGGRVGRHELALDNLGNQAEIVSIAASDQDRQLRFRIAPANPTLAPGTATFIKLQARPKRTYLRGPNKTVPFDVTAAPHDGDPVRLTGVLVQKALLPKWLFKAVAVTALAALALVALWLTVLKPTVESTAEAVAEDHTEELADAIKDATAKADQASSDASAAEQNAQSAGENAADAEEAAEDAAGGAGAANLDPAEAVAFRVTTEVSPKGGFEDTEYEIAEDRTLWVSDLVLQNPAGDAGMLRVQRGDDVLWVFGLQNFRDLDYHFMQPAQFDSSAPVVISVDCQNPKQACTPSVYFSGQSITTKKTQDQ